MMKKLFRSIPVVKKYVDILVNIDDYKDNSQVAATEFIVLINSAYIFL